MVLDNIDNVNNQPMCFCLFGYHIALSIHFFKYVIILVGFVSTLETHLRANTVCCLIIKSGKIYNHFLKIIFLKKKPKI